MISKRKILDRIEELLRSTTLSVPVVDEKGERIISQLHFGTRGP